MEKEYFSKVEEVEAEVLESITSFSRLTIKYPRLNDEELISLKVISRYFLTEDFTTNQMNCSEKWDVEEAESLYKKVKDTPFEYFYSAQLKLCKDAEYRKEMIDYFERNIVNDFEKTTNFLINYFTEDLPSITIPLNTGVLETEALNN